MSITNDVRSYADAALEQGKQAVDHAQAKLTEVAGDATGLAGKVGGTAAEVAEKVQGHAQGFAGKASGTYGELRNFGESVYGRVVALPVVESAASTAEPYVAQLNGYRLVVTGKIEAFYADLKKNDQMAKVLDGAEAVAGLVLGTVNERVVKPVRSLVESAPATHSAPVKAAAGRAPAKTTTVKATPVKTASAKTGAAKRTASRQSTPKA